jgi:hypothetical protein
VREWKLGNYFLSGQQSWRQFGSHGRGTNVIDRKKKNGGSDEI